MIRLNKKSEAGNRRNDKINIAAVRTASLSARDPLAYAAAIKILG